MPPKIFPSDKQQYFHNIFFQLAFLCLQRQCFDKLYRHCWFRNLLTWPSNKKSVMWSPIVLPSNRFKYDTLYLVSHWRHNNIYSTCQNMIHGYFPPFFWHRPPKYELQTAGLHWGQLSMVPAYLRREFQNHGAYSRETETKDQRTYLNDQ